MQPSCPPDKPWARLVLKFLGDIAYKSLVSFLVSLCAIPLGFFVHEMGGGLACFLCILSFVVLMVSSWMAIVVIAAAYMRYSLQTLLLFILVCGAFVSFLVMDSVALQALGLVGLAFAGLAWLASVYYSAPD